jgi:L-lactate dehydrogenase complex protein LldG
VSKEVVLSSVRKALTGDPQRSTEPTDLKAWPPLGRVLAGVEPADLVAKFEQEIESVAASAHRVSDRSEIGPLLGRILDGTRASGVVLSRNPLLARLRLESILSHLDVPAWTWPAESPAAGLGEGQAGEPGYREHCFSAAAGITGLDFALAESGSLVLTSATEGAQLSSLAPPIHIAFYLRSQVVETLEEVFQHFARSGGESSAGRGGRSIVFVTGTSRTADIEQILIRGVHGPRELHAVLVEEPCLADPD